MTTNTASHFSTDQQKHEAERSPQWPAFRDAFIKKNPVCVCCGSTVGLQAHHVFPFHYCIALGRPDLELNEGNLITLCEHEEGKQAENHHLLIGHLDDFESSNLDVRHDATVTYKNWTAAQIQADAGWQQKKAKRLPHIGDMTANDKAAFKWAMNTVNLDANNPPGPKPENLPDWIPATLRS